MLWSTVTMPLSTGSMEMAPLLMYEGMLSTRTLQSQEDAMDAFIEQHEKNVIGVTSGLDRLVLRGTLRSLAVAAGMMDFLYRMGVLLKNFGAFVEQKTKLLRDASTEAARRLDRPVRYLPSSTVRKEEVARDIAEADGISDGLICVLSCVEPCMSYEIYRNRAEKRLVLQPRWRKCLHLYHYWVDPVFGFMSARVQTWFPFTIHVCLNGREWLARQMDQAGMAYERRRNCFARIDDVARAQKLMDEQLTVSWPEVLNAVAHRLNPAHAAMLAPYRANYYWTVHQSEWATDVMFKSPRALAAVYPALVRGAITAFSCRDVMRFLGKRLTCFEGEAVSDCRQRPEGVRVKHRVKANSVKVYDKEGSVLRVETTINDPYDFNVFRPKEGDPDGPCSWRRMRKGVADLHRRAAVSQRANDRYLEALAALDTGRQVGDFVENVCRPVQWKGRRIRALRPWSQEDRLLLELVSRGEYVVNGFRNRDIRLHLFPTSDASAASARRASARITTRLRLLRAHGLIRKVPRTHRYMLTARGRQITAALLQTQHLTLEALASMAA